MTLKLNLRRRPSLVTGIPRQRRGAVLALARDDFGIFGADVMDASRPVAEFVTSQTAPRTDPVSVESHVGDFAQPPDVQPSSFMDSGGPAGAGMPMPQQQYHQSISGSYGSSQAECHLSEHGSHAMPNTLHPMYRWCKR